MNWKDEIVEEVRAARQAYFARFNYNLDLMFEDLKEKQEQDPWPKAKLKLVARKRQMVDTR
jgi:hypothetical protein